MSDRSETLDIPQGVYYDVHDARISKIVIFIFIIFSPRVLCSGISPYTHVYMRIAAYSCRQWATAAAYSCLQWTTAAAWLRCPSHM